MVIHVSVICSSEEVCIAVLASGPPVAGSVINAQMGGAQLLAEVLQRDQPEVIVLDLPEGDESALDQIGQVLHQAPATHLVVVSPEHSERFLLRAMRAGVREVMKGPMTPLSIQLAVQHAGLNSPASSHRLRQPGQVLAFVPSKGGAGATFLATNLAYALSRMDRRVLILDLNLYFGDAAIFLSDKAVTSTVVDLARQAQRLDATLLDSAMIKLSENLHILPAPELPADLSNVSVRGIEKIIDIARNQYDFVVADISRSLDEVAVKALEGADAIYMTLQLSLPFIRAAKHMAQVLQNQGCAHDKLKLVMNRYEGGGAIDLADAESAIQLKVHLTIPNSHLAVSDSINQGIALVELTPRDAVAHALQDCARGLVPEAIAPTPKGWLRKLVEAA